ncbi:hypothetical protein [Nonomuraea sp. SYSU D8015]|uniref:hypothetical protein n=1 Tax=Nonomuraea sp. SYSU D8015 TaxID=2593644 RepID=UPI0016613975|nr:hypothetical protein [Nonomuraea sp. SYSU D8015]
MAIQDLSPCPERPDRMGTALRAWESAGAARTPVPATIVLVLAEVDVIWNVVFPVLEPLVTLDEVTVTK